MNVFLLYYIVFVRVNATYLERSFRVEFNFSLHPFLIDSTENRLKNYTTNVEDSLDYYSKVTLRRTAGKADADF